MKTDFRARSRSTSHPPAESDCFPGPAQGSADPAPRALPDQLPPLHGKLVGSGALAPLLTLSELARLLRLSERTIRRLTATGRLPCVRIGTRLRFDPADVFRFVAARKE